MDDQTDETPTNTLKNQERLLSIAAWQARWDRSKNARWTQRLIPDVSRWLAKPPLNLTYRLTQALSSHGCFKSYLRIMNRAEDSYCVYCVDPNDTAEHTVFVCPRWTDNRSRMVELLRSPTLEDVQKILCGPRPQDLPPDVTSQSRLLEQAKANRREFVKMVESIVSTKEDDEREDEAYNWDAVNRRLVYEDVGRASLDVKQSSEVPPTTTSSFFPVAPREGRRSQHRTRLPEGRTAVGSGKVLHDRNVKQQNKNKLYL